MNFGLALKYVLINEMFLILLILEVPQYTRMYFISFKQYL